MAIRWSDEYPGQIAIDPGYPHGKPRNVAVPGDGTGTPLEAAWVSDLAGWQAALLDEAGIVPSGDPDKVGASDYVDAIKVLASSGDANFANVEHTWTEKQTFTAGVVANSIGVQDEVLYVDAAGVPTRKLKWITLSMPSGGGVGTSYETTLGMNAVGIDPGATRCIPLDSMVPTDSQIAGVTALLYNNNPTTTTMVLEIIAMTINVLDGSMLPTVVYTTSLDVLTGTTGLISVADLPHPWHTVDRSWYEYQVRVRATGGGHLRRVAIGVAQPGPRNW